MTDTTTARRPDSLTRREQEALVRAATLAPSVHNTQPWTFEVGPSHVTVLADPDRHLRRGDPSGRSLLISCGAAVLNLRVAAEFLGLRPRVRVLPVAGNPKVVARVDLDPGQRRPGASAELYAMVAARRTNRQPFAPRPVAAAAVAALTEAAEAENAVLRAYRDRVDVERLIDLLHDADREERRRPGVREERARWVGVPLGDDGVPEQALGPVPAGSRTAFRDLRAVDVPAGAGETAVFEPAPTVAMLSTRHDEPVDWVRAGMALERVLLVATMHGVSASFMNQPLEDHELRWLSRSPVDGVGHGQMIMRLGYGAPVPPTPRRPLDAVTHHVDRSQR